MLTSLLLTTYGCLAAQSIWTISANIDVPDTFYTHLYRNVMGCADRSGDPRLLGADIMSMINLSLDSQLQRLRFLYGNVFHERFEEYHLIYTLDPRDEHCDIDVEKREKPGSYVWGEKFLLKRTTLLVMLLKCEP